MNLANNLFLVTEWPTGFWENIIKWFAGVGSIGLAIMLLTICLKLVLFPLDFYQKRSSRKMAANQALMQPELEKIKEKYGNNPQLAQAKQMEVYRKYNLGKSAGRSLIVMLVYMVLTMVIFFTLFSGLTNISHSKISYEYSTLQQEYKAVYSANQSNPDAQTIAQNAVVEKYDNIREGFLSIKNIWRPDNWSSVFPTGEEFLKSTGAKFQIFEYDAPEGKISYVYLTNSEKLVDGNEKEYIAPYTTLENKVYVVYVAEGTNPANVTIGDTTYEAIYKNGELQEQQTYADLAVNSAIETYVSEFNTVTAGINEKYKGQWNGFLGLVVLAGAVTFLSSYLSTLGLKTKDKKGNVVKGAKPKPTMGIILALVMVFFTISYTSAFAIYIITNSIMAMLLNFLTNVILNKLEERKEKKETPVADYIRR